MTLKRVGGLTGLRLEISDPYYLYINMHIAYMVPYDGLWGHYSLQTPSDANSDNILEFSDLNYVPIHVHIDYMEWTLLAASEAPAASKQPQRSNITTDLKSVTTMT